MLRKMPKESVLRELELFMTNVVPHLDAASFAPAVEMSGVHGPGPSD